MEVANAVSMYINRSAEMANATGRQLVAQIPNTGNNSWVENAMIPMSFMVFAMYLLDVLQRLFPHTMWGSSNSEAFPANGQQSPTPPTRTTEIKIGTSLFGRRSGPHNPRPISQRPDREFDKGMKMFPPNGRRRPSRLTKPSFRNNPEHFKIQPNYLRKGEYKGEDVHPYEYRNQDEIIRSLEKPPLYQFQGI